MKHAEGLVERAAAQGATMVVLPELFSCGYVPNRGAWEAAEARGGHADRWLGIYLGAGAAETDGADFFNVFILAAPDGQIAGRAYKASAEASIFRPGTRQRRRNRL